MTEAQKEEVRKKLTTPRDPNQQRYTIPLGATQLYKITVEGVTYTFASQAEAEKAFEKWLND